MQEGADAVAGAQLLAIVERVEACHEEKRAIEADIKDIYAEAKANGYDVPTIRAIVKRRGQDKDTVAEAETLLELYLQAIEKASHTRPMAA